ncbi:hypothetical protein J2X72_001060 [Phyllobacterium sp. 1468]|nr:hypothetical protein [Phyllobacterium sp. 1468]
MKSFIYPIATAMASANNIPPILRILIEIYSQGVTSE